jgi:chromosome segregation ATPase
MDEQRPSDPLTALEAAGLFAQIKDLAKDYRQELQRIRAQLATINKQHLEILETLARIEAGSSASRIDRLEIELKEAELDKEAAELALQKAQEKLNIKQDVRKHTLDTQERIKEVAAGAIVDLEKRRQAEREERFRDIKWSAVKAIIVTGAVGLAAGVFGFVWWLIQLYVSRGSP